MSEPGPSVHASAIVDAGVRIGPGSEVGPFCHFCGRVTVGRGCRFATGVVVGAPPMDREYRGEETEVVIGEGNVFHEYATVHRSTGPGTRTSIGDRNRVMAYVHIAHNCRVGDDCVLTNGVQLGGHVEVGDGANIGGLAGVHQFCRIGELAMVGACSYVNKDIPPFALASGNPCRVRGLNSVGLVRADVGAEATAALKRAFRLFYRSRLNRTDAVDRIEEELLPSVSAPDAAELLSRFTDFFRESRRGVELRPGRDMEEA